MAPPLNTFLRYLVTKTKWTCSAKTQCLPRRISFDNSIDQESNRVVSRLQAFQFELRPDGEQLRNLRQFAGSCRFVYNKAPALNVQRYEKKETPLGYAGLCALLPNWKREHEFLSNVPAQTSQQALKNLERAYTNFFQKPADFPKFKKKGQRENFRFPQGFEVDNQNRGIKLPKLGWMRYRKSQDLLGEASNVSISESCGKWYVSIQTQREAETPRHPSTSAGAWTGAQSIS
jgi:putative transposase